MLLALLFVSCIFAMFTHVSKVMCALQTQISDQDQMVTMHRNHCADLQECVQAISTKLFEANLEVQRLHREIMAQRAQPIADLDEECIDIAVSEIKRKWVHSVSCIHTIDFRVSCDYSFYTAFLCWKCLPSEFLTNMVVMQKDVEQIILEARRLNEEVKRLEGEEETKDNLAQAKSRQCESLSKKVSSLATELEDVKSAAHGKQRLLEAKEQENLKLSSVLRDLQHKLEIGVHISSFPPSSSSLLVLQSGFLSCFFYPFLLPSWSWYLLS